jgi:hypothetical protein
VIPYNIGEMRPSPTSGGAARGIFAALTGVRRVALRRRPYDAAPSNREAHLLQGARAPPFGLVRQSAVPSHAITSACCAGGSVFAAARKHAANPRGAVEARRQLLRTPRAPSEVFVAAVVLVVVTGATALRRILRALAAAPLDENTATSSRVAVEPVNVIDSVPSIWSQESAIVNVEFSDAAWKAPYTAPFFPFNVPPAIRWSFAFAKIAAKVMVSPGEIDVRSAVSERTRGPFPDESGGEAASGIPTRGATAACGAVSARRCARRPAAPGASEGDEERGGKELRGAH